MKTLFTALIFTALSISSTTGLATEKKCGDIYLPIPPKMNDDVYSLNVASDCVMSGVSSRSLTALARFLKDDTLIAKKNNTVDKNAEPIPEKYKGYDGFKYDITDTSVNAHGDKSSIRSDLHIATDGKDHLIFENLSTKIEGAGDSKYQKKTDLLIDIQRDSDPSVINVHLEQHEEVIKPHIPLIGKIFKSQVDSNVKSDFAKTVESLKDKIGDTL